MLSFIDEKHECLLLKKYTLLVIIDAIVLIFAIFLCHLDESVEADGIIRPSVDENCVKVLFSGKLKDIYYKNTQFVRKNDILLVQDCNYEQEYLENLQKLIKLYEKNLILYKQLQMLLDITTTEHCLFDAEILKTNSFYSSFINQYKNYRSELIAKEKYFERQKVLCPGVISKQDIENIENDYLQYKEKFLSWIEEKKIEVFENIFTQAQKLEECKLNIVQTKILIDNATIRASQDGFVNEIEKLKIGDFIDEGTLILTIIPDNAHLKAIVNISNSNISKIKIGQEVLFQIKDLPYTKYGKLKGKVCLIPSDAVVSDTVYFPVEINLEKNFLQARNQIKRDEKVLLKVGTKVSAKIIVDKNTIFQKLIQKLVIYDN